MRGLLVLVVAALSMPLVACSVPVNGLTGVSVDAGGNLTVVLAWCGPTQPDSVTVYHEDERGEVTDAVYVAPRLTGQVASFRLDDPGSSGWQLEGAPILREETAYHAYGGTKDNSFATGSVRFRLGATEQLRPGQVLLQGQEEGDSVVSQAEFEGQVRCG